MSSETITEIKKLVKMAETTIEKTKNAPDVGADYQTAFLFSLQKLVDSELNDFLQMFELYDQRIEFESIQQEIRNSMSNVWSTINSALCPNSEGGSGVTRPEALRIRTSVLGGIEAFKLILCKIDNKIDLDFLEGKKQNENINN